MKVKMKEDQTKYLFYNPCVDKNHQGRLYSSDLPPDLKAMERVDDRTRCPVTLYESLMAKRKPGAPHRLFLRALACPKGDIFYYNSPMGKDKVNKMMSELSLSAGEIYFFPFHPFFHFFPHFEKN